MMIQQTTIPFTLNAAFSLASGLAMLLAADWMAQALIMTDPLLFTLTGSVLLGFAALIMSVVIKGVPLRGGLFIAAQDGLWIILTSAGLVAFSSAFTALGIGMLLAVNAVVLGFTVAQLGALRKRLAQPDAGG